MSLERERFLAILLDCLSPMIGRPGLLLDVAPSKRLTPLLSDLRPRLRIGIDFDPSADGRLVDLQASLTDLPLASATVDLMVCYHVLEHIPDDGAAIAEMARVLRPGGLAIVQVPWRPGRPTDEDPSADAAERLRRFGQVDHVRYYGEDFESRLRAGGLGLRRVTPQDLLGLPACRWMHLNPAEAVWLCRPGDTDTGGSETLASAGPLAAALTALDADAAGLRTRLAAQEVRWQARYAELDRHWLLKAYRRVRRPLVRVIGRR